MSCAVSPSPSSSPATCSASPPGGSRGSPSPSASPDCPSRRPARWPKYCMSAWPQRDPGRRHRLLRARCRLAGLPAVSARPRPFRSPAAGLRRQHGAGERHRRHAVRGCLAKVPHPLDRMDSTCRFYRWVDAEGRAEASRSSTVRCVTDARGRWKASSWWPIPPRERSTGRMLRGRSPTPSYRARRRDRIRPGRATERRARAPRHAEHPADQGMRAQFTGKSTHLSSHTAACPTSSHSKPAPMSSGEAHPRSIRANPPSLDELQWRVSILPGSRGSSKPRRNRACARCLIQAGVANTSAPLPTSAAPDRYRHPTDPNTPSEAS